MPEKDVTVTIRRDQAAPEPLELIAASIVKLADAVDQMKKSGLTNRAIGVLIKDVTRVSMTDIELILNCAPQLRRAFITKP